MWMDLMTASGERSLTTFVPGPPGREDMNGSTIAISSWRARSVTACALASRMKEVRSSSRSMRVSIFPPSKPACLIEAAS